MLVGTSFPGSAFHWTLGLCYSIHPPRDPRRSCSEDLCTDKKTEAPSGSCRRPPPSSWDSPAGQRGCSRPSPPHPGFLLLGSLSCLSHAVGVQEGLRALDTGSPRRGAGGCRLPFRGPVRPPPRQRPAHLPEGSADEAGRGVSGTCFSDAHGHPAGQVLR